MSNFDAVSDSLFSHKKLDRDRGITALKDFLKKGDAKDIVELRNLLLKTLLDRPSTWEVNHGALLGCREVILDAKGRQIDQEFRQFLDRMRELCMEFLEDTEVRIRLASGKVLGSLCELEGPVVYDKCCSALLELIRTNFERESSDQMEDSQECPDMNRDFKHRTSDASQIFHDTAGWKCLETSMKCLQYMVDGCGERFKPYIQNELLELLFKTLSHTNRFVRETGYYLVGTLVACGTTCDENENNPFTADGFGHHVAKQLGVGLGDNWSQVRLASSESARKFLLSFKTEEEREQFYSALLPKLCLNRYYVADGVRLYSQESWRLIAKQNGKMLVKKYIDKFVEYYIMQTKADNHAVREAACACIAEMAAKIDKEAVKPHVQELLNTLLECFRDESWPVRDAACLACGNFVLCYPEESKSVITMLYPLFFDNLSDSIPSVRLGAAAALANVVKAYGFDAYNVMVGNLKSGLENIKSQPSETERYGQMEKGPGNFGVVKRLRDNDMVLHTDQTMYSCGSLAPKMGRGGAGGPTDHKFRKISEPWEISDGCLNLIAELIQVPSVTSHVKELLPLIVEATTHKHYTSHVFFHESLCKQLPYIANGIGKQAFKQYLDMFMDPIFYSLTCENMLTSSAAVQCLTQLSKFFGPNIFRGRIEAFNPSYLPLYDDIDNQKVNPPMGYL